MAERVRASVVLGAFLRRSWHEQTSALTPAVLSAASFVFGIFSQSFLGRLVDAAPNGELGAYAGRYGVFLLLGMALLDLQNAIVAGLARRIRDAQISGALEGLFSTPAPAPLILFGLALPDLLYALLRLAVYAAAGRFLFGLRLCDMNFLGCAVVLGLALAGFVGLALVGAALTVTLRRADPLNLLVAATAAIAGGVFFPRTLLPRALVLAGDALPIVPALEALRAAAVKGLGPSELGAPLLHLVALVAALLPLGAWLFARSLARARVGGSLTSY